MTAGIVESNIAEHLDELVNMDGADVMEVHVALGEH